jgi:hypothetical protein
MSAWRFSWWWVAIVGVAVAALVFALWYHSDRDLRIVAARAAALGVSQTWTATGLARSPQTRLDDWHRLGALAQSLTDYEAKSDSFRLKPGFAVPGALRAHHAGLPADDIATVLQLCARLEPDSIVETVEIDIFDTSDSLSWGRSLSRLLGERLAIIPGAQVADEARYHLRAIQAEPPRSLIRILVANNRFAVWQGAIILRLRDPEIDQQALAALIDEARIWYERAMRDAWAGEYRWMHALATGLRAGNERYADALVGDFGLVPNWGKPFGLHMLAHRAIRDDTMHTALDLHEAWLAAPDAAGRCSAVQAIERRRTAQNWNLPQRLAAMWLPAFDYVTRSWAERDTQLRVLAAELRGEPWPIDPLDPARKPVRRIEREGRLIGYYLLKDGTDDGGHTNKDRCTALYDALGSPMAAD